MGAMPTSEGPTAPADPLPVLLKQVADGESALELEVQSSKRLLEKVFANVNDHFAILDRDLRYTYVNDAAVQMLGLPREKLIGQCIWDLFPKAAGTLFYHETERALAEQRT